MLTDSAIDKIKVIVGEEAFALDELSLIHI